jgi:hypothetical protein
VYPLPPAAVDKRKPPLTEWLPQEGRKSPYLKHLRDKPQTVPLHLKRDIGSYNFPEGKSLGAIEV